MTAIQRFALHGTIMNPHSHGPYVRHEDHLAAMQGRCLAQIEEPAQPVAEICSASHDDAQFGERAIKPLCDISGFDYGTPLYAGAAPAAVAGPALALVERQALEALCAVAVAAFHAADDSSDEGASFIQVQRADFEKLDAALDLLDELPDDQPGSAMLPGAKGKWALRRLLDAAPALEAPAAPMREVLTDGQITDALWRTHLRWMEQCGIDTEGMRPTGTWLEHWLIYARAVERAALAAAPQAPAAPPADERAAYVEFLAGKFPKTYSKEDAEHWWDHGHVSALTWQAARAVAAAPAAPAVDAWLQPADMAALQRFHETAEDDESYDIGKEAVARLCAFGCLQSHSFGRYSTTDFGDYLLDTWAGARTLPFTTAAEREARAAQAAAKGEHDD